MADRDKPNDVLPVLGSCCFFVPLRLGSQIIAWYYFIGGILGLVPIVTKVFDVATSISTTGNTGENVMKLLLVEYYFLIFLMMASSAYLINGIKKKILKQIRPFYVYGTICLFHSFSVFLFYLFTPLRKDAEELWKKLLPIETLAYAAANPYYKLVDLVIGSYSVLVVRSYYKTLKREASRNNSGAIV